MYSINEFLKKSIIQMTGEEFCQLTRYANSGNGPAPAEEHHYAHGVSELAECLGCCPSTIYAMRRAGKLEPAIVSRLGKKIIFDVEKAKELSIEYQNGREEN